MRVSLRKQICVCASLTFELRHTLSVHFLHVQSFAENLFKLFDNDCSESISLQELVGGMGRLTA